MDFNFFTTFFNSLFDVQSPRFCHSAAAQNEEINRVFNQKSKPSNLSMQIVRSDNPNICMKLSLRDGTPTQIAKYYQKLLYNMHELFPEAYTIATFCYFLCMLLFIVILGIL
jgi:hypothetical protein